MTPEIAGDCPQCVLDEILDVSSIFLANVQTVSWWNQKTKQWMIPSF
jgi:hypothetical protein